MSGKYKFQISRTLDERIKKIVAASGDSAYELGDEYSQSDVFKKVTSAFILGFQSANTTNYVGLTTDYKLFHAGLQVVGLVFFKSHPSDDEIATNLELASEFSLSPDGFGLNFKEDKNNFFLVYTFDNESKIPVKKIFDLPNKTFAPEQPKLSVLDEPKIYNHSFLAKLNVCVKILKASEDPLLDAKKLFSNESKNIRITLSKSNFSTSSSISDTKTPTDSIYDHLDAPDELEQMGDYLSQMSKKEKDDLLKKWRNKVKSQRAPLELSIELGDDISIDTTADCPSNCYKLNLESFVYLHVNDSLSKTIRFILFVVRNRIDLLKQHINNQDDLKSALEANYIRPCTFKPHKIGHLIPLTYSIPDKVEREKLLAYRELVHSTYLLPMTQPLVRYSQRILNVRLENESESAGFLCNVHAGIIENSGIKGGNRNIVEGTYTYHHYLQHRVSDSGWGCAYRSLQSIISWFIHQGYIYSPDLGQPDAVVDKTSSLREKLNRERRVPTHEEIQSVLVDVGDKPASFVGSQKWIGSQEVCYVLSHLYKIDSKFITVSSGSELVYKARDLGQHFAKQGTPVMIGGGKLAHTIIGVDFNEKNGDISYLILDPHYTGGEDLGVITKKGWCGWKKNSFWEKSAFYNLCLPQAPCEI